MHIFASEPDSLKNRYIIIHFFSKSDNDDIKSGDFSFVWPVNTKRNYTVYPIMKKDSVWDIFYDYAFTRKMIEEAVNNDSVIDLKSIPKHTGDFDEEAETKHIYQDSLYNNCSNLYSITVHHGEKAQIISQNRCTPPYTGETVEVMICPIYARFLKIRMPDKDGRERIYFIPYDKIAYDDKLLSVSEIFFLYDYRKFNFRPV